MKYALALAGGGTRGAFQAGVWQALGEMGIEISAVAGTSIGAVNGAMFAMGIDPAELWLKTDISDIVKIGENNGNLFSIKSLRAVMREELKGGLDTAPFKKLLSSLIDEEKLRGCPMDYGLCTYCVTDKKSVELFKEDIPRGYLVDYILASACFPMFKNIVINDKEYADGGIQNNLPSGMLINRGYDTIISVSVNGIGFVRDVDRCGINIIKIDSPAPEVGLMDFDHEAIERSMKSGYFETMRTFGKCRGESYFIDNYSYGEFVSQYGSEIVKGLELAAGLSGVDRYRMYTVQELTESVMVSYTKNLRLKHMTEIIRNSEHGFIREKLDVLGNLFHAANTIIYLTKK
ncbi:MAG: patatin-like phospholipase family protein [Clostridiales bacterium]|nr:patatin-like phospholipase family protein [Clostridiales bacterium]